MRRHPGPSASRLRRRVLPSKAMIWLYRLQQRLALTSAECVALFALSALFAAGLGARHLLGRTQPYGAEDYAELDRLFEAASAARPPEAAASVLSGPDSTEGSERAAEDAASAGPPAARWALEAAPVDLNAASATELERLPRVGPAMAARIVAHRERQGPFRTTRDLLDVAGIGEKTLAVLQPLVRVEPPIDANADVKRDASAEENADVNAER